MRVRTIVFTVAVAFLAACRGDLGPAGPIGPAGQDGQDGQDGQNGQSANQQITGTVDVPDNSPAAAGTPVVAIILDWDGNELAALGATQTDNNGQFSIGVPVDLTLNPQVMLVAAPPGHRLTALVTSATQDIDAVTNGVANAVRTTVGAPAGTGMPAYDVTEVADLVTAAAAALTTAGTDLADADAVLDEIFNSVGADISAASGATPQVEVSVSTVTQDPPGSDAAASFPAFLVDGGGDVWDIESNGTVSDGTADSYDTFFELFLDGNQFTGTGSGSVRDLRTVVLSQTNVGGSGIDVTRKIYVSPNQSFARFTEALSNPGVTDVNVIVTVGGNLGSDESIDLVNHSSSGDQEVGPGDVWLANHMDIADPALGWIFNGAEPAKSGDDLSWFWNILVPAGGTVTLFHFAFQRSERDVDGLADELSVIGALPPASFYRDATIADATSGLNGGFTASVFGQEGSVVSRETLMIENTTTAASETIVAGLNGAFVSSIRATSGDVITIVGDKGTDVMVTVP